MLNIVLATANSHKVEEINQIAKPFGINFVLPNGDFDPVEDGQTFEQNAYIKAICAAKYCQGDQKYFLADDSGLCVDYLDGAPGIKSARYADSAQKRIDKLLDALKNAQNNQRSAKFVCSLILCDKDGKILHKTLGICKGKIAHKMSGANGFGYDPIFIPHGMDKSMADLNAEEKNVISHRGKALLDMLIWINCALK